MMRHSIHCDRRAFIAGALATPFFGCCSCRNKPPRRVPANQKVNVGIIGCGAIAKWTNVPGFLKDPRCRITVVCDMVKVAPGYFYGEKPKDAAKADFLEGDIQCGAKVPSDVCGSTIIRNQVNAGYGDKDCREVFDWRDVVDDPTIDAVCICTPDHWHAIIAIAAMRAGKHVFCQKPMSLSIAEGKAMVKVAKETGVTFQTGNQARSSPDFIFAEMLALNGYGGKITGGLVSIPEGDHWVGHGRSEERAPLPKWMSPEAWEMWQGPAEHWENNAFIPSIHEPTCWRFNKRYGNGMVADFGAHEFDEIQRGLGTDLTGPVRVENMKSDLLPEDQCKVFSWAKTFSFDFVYANGVRINVVQINKEKGVPRQVIWHTEKGDIGVVKGGKGKIILPDELKNFTWKDFKKSDTFIYKPQNDHWHEADFIDGILQERQCCSPCEVGHRTISMAHVANACIRLRIDGIGWDPVKEVFTGPHADEAMAKCYSTEYHNGWELGA